MGTGILSFHSHLIFFPLIFENAGITLDLIIHSYEHTSTYIYSSTNAIYVDHPVKSFTLLYTHQTLKVFQDFQCAFSVRQA